MVQLWVNLPAKDKMRQPKYQGLTAAAMGKYELPDGKGYVDVVAGEFKGIKGAASTFTPYMPTTYTCRPGPPPILNYPQITIRVYW